MDGWAASKRKSGQTIAWAGGQVAKALREGVGQNYSHKRRQTRVRGTVGSWLNLVVLLPYFLRFIKINPAEAD
jgi:hypothetical protein